jgi:hypothetical protein
VRIVPRRHRAVTGVGRIDQRLVFGFAVRHHPQTGATDLRSEAPATSAERQGGKYCAATMVFDATVQRSYRAWWICTSSDLVACRLYTPQQAGFLTIRSFRIWRTCRDG